MINRSWFVTSLLLILILAGCLNPQHFRERRISENQQTFNSFSQDTQAKLRAGQIDIGFSQQMVYIAWGKADRIYSRVTDKGEVTVWAYTSTRLRTESSWISVPVRVINKDGKSVIRYRRIWVDKDRREEYTVARVEFTDGSVSAIEQLETN